MRSTASAIGRESPVLLISDIVMPGMNGRVLSDRLRVTYPELKVLFVSGLYRRCGGIERVAGPWHTFPAEAVCPVGARQRK